MLLYKGPRDQILAPLQSVCGIVEKRHTLPILSNVLIEKDAERLTLLATDIEIQITTGTAAIGPEKTALTSVHWDGAQTATISGPGDFTSAPGFAAASTLTKRLFLSAIQVNAAPGARALVLLGDSITDGYCSTPDANHRWPDRLAERLQQARRRNIAVVNEAFSGDRVLMNGMGNTPLCSSRAHRWRLPPESAM